MFNRGSLKAGLLSYSRLILALLYSLYSRTILLAKLTFANNNILHRLGFWQSFITFNFLRNRGVGYLKYLSITGLSRTAFFRFSNSPFTTLYAIWNMYTAPNISSPNRTPSQVPPKNKNITAKDSSIANPSRIGTCKTSMTLYISSKFPKEISKGRNKN